MRKTYILEYEDKKYYFGLNDSLNEIIIMLHDTQFVLNGTAKCARFFSNLFSYVAAPATQINFHVMPCKIITSDAHARVKYTFYKLLHFKNNQKFLDIFSMRLPRTVIECWLQLIFRGSKC